MPAIKTSLSLVDVSDGRGVESLVTQYYLSTSDTAQTGGEWSDTPADYVSGKYYWTRDYITWTDGTTATTAPVLDKGLNAANATAESKNAVFYADTAPSGSGYKLYDVWFDTDDGGAMYYWNGSAWTQKKFGTGAVADSAITADLIAANAVTADKIVAGAVTAGKIAANAVTANEIAANAVTAAKMDVSELSAITANMGTITGGLLQLGTNAVTELKNDGTGHIGAWNFDATKLYNGTYGADSSVYFSTANMASQTIGGRTGADWRLTIGSKFGVTSNGSVYASGGSLGGWTFTDKYMYSSANAPAANNVFMMPTGTVSSYTIAGVASTGWVFTASNTVGITAAGGLYSTSGKIGGWTIGADSLSSGSTSGTNAQITLKSGNSGYIRVQNATAGTTELNNAGFLHETSSGQINIAGGALTIADKAHSYPSYLFSIGSRSLSCMETTGETLKIFLDGTTGNITAAGEISEGGTTLANKYATKSELAGAIVKEDINFTGSFTAGTIGTRGWQGSVTNPHPSYTIIGIILMGVSASQSFLPVAFYSGGEIYCNFYRATTSALSSGTVTVRVVYRVD